MDLGCGLGYFLHGAVIDKTFNCVGVDISDDAINYVKSTFGYEVKNEIELDSFEQKILTSFLFFLLVDSHIK